MTLTAPLQGCSMLSLYGTTDLVPGLAPLCGREVMQRMMPLIRSVKKEPGDFIQFQYPFLQISHVKMF